MLLSDPRALFKFKEQEVVIPIIVINELEKKRHDPEIGYYARQALRHLDDLRIQHERLDFPMEVGEGGLLRVELNHIDQSVLPAGFQLGDNDSRILAVAFNLASEGCDVTVVSKDLPMRVKASALGMSADEYRNDNAKDSGWTGISELNLSGDEIKELLDSGKIDRPQSSGGVPRPVSAQGSAVPRAGKKFGGSASPAPTPSMPNNSASRRPSTASIASSPSMARVKSTTPAPTKARN